MKFMLMMNCPRNAYEFFGSMPKEDIRANIAYMREIDEYLLVTGELVSEEGLDDPRNAKRVRAGRNGEPVTDEVFPDAKEYVAGYWIVDVPTAERAYEIAARASAAPGIGGAPLNMAIEVRQVMDGPPKEFL